MTRPYSSALEQKMIRRLIGKDAFSVNQLEEETGVFFSSATASA
jgi:hypothetical protein